MYFKKLTGEICYLSPMSPDDYEKMTAWMNDIEITTKLGTADQHVTAVSERTYLEEIAQSAQHFYSIIDLATDECIGNCELRKIDNMHRNAEIGILIGEKNFWGHGYGQEALKLLIGYAFSRLNLHSVYLSVFDFNQSAIACYKKVGFKEIGKKRESFILGDEKHDTLLMDLLSSEFE